jgi:hypothetical protein
MATHYYDENHLKLLKEMGKLAPHEFKAWADLDKIVRPRRRPDLEKVSGTYRLSCRPYHSTTPEGSRGNLAPVR